MPKPAGQPLGPTVPQQIERRRRNHVANACHRNTTCARDGCEKAACRALRNGEQQLVILAARERQRQRILAQPRSNLARGGVNRDRASVDVDTDPARGGHLTEGIRETVAEVNTRVCRARPTDGSSNAAPDVRSHIAADCQSDRRL